MTTEKPELPGWVIEKADGSFEAECGCCGRDCQIDYMSREELIEVGEDYRFYGGCSERCIP